MDKKKISIKEYIDNNELLEMEFIPFDTKMEIVSQVINQVIKTVGGLNTSLLRRISTEVFVEAITNIDMSMEDENGLGGFDQLYFYNKFDDFIGLINREYSQFAQILDERIADYIRIETNPSVTIQAIYKQVSDYLGTAMDYLSDKIQNIDVEEFGETLKDIASLTLNGGDQNEG